jgi:hypothetical protein
MKGYRTIVVNVIALLALAATALLDIDVDADAQASIATGVLAVVNIILRAVTTTPMGQK